MIAGPPPIPTVRMCCDSHNRHCEPPGDLWCHDCTEIAHDSSPTRHGDGSHCVMEDHR